jgi:hypothetical protein
MSTLITKRDNTARTLFSDPAAGRELMRRLTSPHGDWWRRAWRGRIRRAKLGGETVISDRWR